jgi:glycosyltransferase involved in cell wall biosynthesis/GT2 family glycosyltransferase
VVLFVSYSGILGGAERLLLDYATTLPGDGCVACPPGALAEAATAAGVTVLLRPARSLELRGGLRRRLLAAGEIVAHAREVRLLAGNLDADLVVAWGMRSGIAAMLAGVRYVLAHNDLLPGPVIALAVRAAARRARATVALSAAIAAELPGSPVVVHPGVDVAAFAPRDGEAPADPPEVLVLGAIVPWKRPDLALEAVALARRRLPELRLRLAGAPLNGETELVERLRARSREPDLAGAVTLAGHEPEPRRALARASCLLHCAPREPFGLAVLEALAAGRPVVAPASAGPAEIVDAACGRLYPPGDIAAAADALVEVASDPVRRDEMGRCGQRRARERFDPQVARARFAAVIDRAGAVRRKGDRRAAGDALAILTVTRNSAEDLERLLQSAARHVPAAQVIVVDCASQDRSIEIARGHDGVLVIELPENVGYGRACNRGLARVRAPVTVVLNPDVELVDGSLLTLAGEALRDDVPDRLLAPRVLNRNGTLQDTVHPLPGSLADLVRSLVPPAAIPGRAGTALALWRSRSPRPVGWAVACALAARTSTFRMLGPFDESLFLYGEDLELGLHARQRGVETWLWPAARVIHRRAHSTEREFGGEAFERLARGRHEAVRSRRGPAAARLDDAAQAATFASRLVLKRALGMAATRERRQLAAVASLRRSRGI